MATLASTEADFETPTLRIFYETSRPFPAAELGLILQQLSRSFEGYAARRRPLYRGTTLAVARIETHSLLADLIAVGEALNTIYEHRDLLAGFATHIQAIVQMVAGLLPGHVRQVDRRAVQLLSAPVANDEATQVNINVNVDVRGDHNTVTIDHELATKIRDAIERDRKVKDAAAHIGDLTGPNVFPPTTLLGTSAVTAHLPYQSSRHGTAFDVHGTWYVRLEGEEGTLHEAIGRETLSLQDGQSYLFTGTFEGKRYRLDSAQEIG